MKNFIAYCIRVMLYYLFRIFPVQNNKIFFQNFNGKGYGDNPKYIAEEILRHGLNYKLVWAVRTESSDNFPLAIKTVPFKSIRAIFNEVTAKVWIDNCRKQLYVRKRKEQFYIQTWHGAVNLKKIEKDAEHNLSTYYVKQAKYDSALANLFLSDSKFSSQLYRSAFWYKGEIFECGSPKDDILINQYLNKKNKINQHFRIDDNVKTILYAPTFRDNSCIDVYNLNFEQILLNLQKQTNNPWTFLVRLHPNISQTSKFLTYTKNILNASYYDDMQELMLSCDILITDYSDCMYEFALMNKPVFLYINDYKEYKKERGFYFNLFSLPFPCANDNKELLFNILHFDTAAYLKSLGVFFKEVGVFKDGNASKKVVDRIIAEMEKHD